MENIVLIDLEKNPLQAKKLRGYVEQDQLVYLFNLTGHFDYKLEDMTELAGWISSGLVMMLDVPETSRKELAYAMLAGQLLALTEHDVEIGLISSSKEIHVLVEILQSSGRKVSLETANNKHKTEYRLPTIASFQAQPLLQQVKKYCDALAQMKGLPTGLQGLQNSIGNVLNISAEQSQQLVAMLVNLKIIKRNTSQLSFRKKILKQWIDLDFNQHQQLESKPSDVVDSVIKEKNSGVVMPQVVVGDVDTIMQFLQQQQPVAEGPFPPELDALQWQVLQKLDELQHDRPTDIFSLRDQLQDWFPKADIQMLMKSLLDKGYIQLNDDQLHYTAQMVIH
ncbi:hypothetical protein [Acinetobacter ihumii]|uniref:hypothetical protein n=1 Tax=Acinetobacter ihumii TaxID=2483802 RepID=UPI0010324943|nr:hypothetical protein [Acinetobacter ihumii]